jgi:hypothetical protein
MKPMAERQGEERGRVAVRRDGAELVVTLSSNVAEDDFDVLRTAIAGFDDPAPVVTVEMPSTGAVSRAALEVLADAGRALGASDRLLVLARVDPLLVRRIAEAGHTGSFAVASPRSAE